MLAQMQWGLAQLALVSCDPQDLIQRLVVVVMVHMVTQEALTFD